MLLKLAIEISAEQHTALLVLWRVWVLYDAIIPIQWFVMTYPFSHRTLGAGRTWCLDSSIAHCPVISTSCHFLLLKQGQANTLSYGFTLCQGVPSQGWWFGPLQSCLISESIPKAQIVSRAAGGEGKRENGPGSFPPQDSSLLLFHLPCFSVALTYYPSKMSKKIYFLRMWCCLKRQALCQLVDHSLWTCLKEYYIIVVQEVLWFILTKISRLM